MKKLFSTDTKLFPNDLALLIGRIAIGFLMLTHGIPKMQMLSSAAPANFPAVLGMSAELSLILAVSAEVICSILIIVGLGTRLAALPLIITMLVAIFSYHAEDLFAKKELAILYLAGYVVLFIAGSGKYSADHLFQSKSKLKYSPISE